VIAIFCPLFNARRLRRLPSAGGSMLSFRTTHAITGELLAATRSAGWSSHPLLLIIEDRPAGHPDHPDARHLRVTPIDLPEQLWAAHPGGVAAVLEDLAGGVQDPSRPIRHHDGSFGPHARLLAVAVCYDDIATDPDNDTVAMVRRVDAVDTDGRVYQLTQLPTETNAIAFLDEEPDPRDTPATHPGLSGLLHALNRQTTA
jgi:hypothetical protein